MVIISTEEKFDCYPHAPIVEAVIDIRARAASELTEKIVRERVDAKIPEFAFLDSVKEFHHEINFQDGSPSSQTVHHQGWKGVRYRSRDQRYIVQFNRDGFVISRLEPYENWPNLFGEAMRLWAIYCELAQPLELTRVGLRYINRIRLPVGDLEFEKYITAPPSPPRGLDLPYSEFIHRETLAVVGHPYAINLIKTMQPPTDPAGEGFGLIVDIDVFTTDLIDPVVESVPHRLAEMRWLKNKTFFGSVTNKSLNLFN